MTNHQIYVSYADAKWAINFIDDLKNALCKQLGKISDDFIWAKYRLKGTDDKLLTPKHHLRQSHYLLVIWSPAYLITIGELDINEFSSMERVILVEHDKAEKTAILNTCVGYQFWKENKKGIVVAKSKSQYMLIIQQLARDIADKHPITTDNSKISTGDKAKNAQININGDVLNSNISIGNNNQQNLTGTSQSRVSEEQKLFLPKYIIVMVTDTEFKAFREALKEQDIQISAIQNEEGLYYYPFLLHTTQGELVNCAFTRSNKAELQAQAHIYDVISKLNPQLIIMTGVCGGFDERGVKENDVIFATSVIGYDRERITNDEYKRGIQPQVYRTSKHLLSFITAAQVDLSEKYDIAIHVEKSLASGDKLLNDRNSELRQNILNISSDIYGFEMEGIGMLHALWSAAGNQVDATVIKAVSDFGDENMQDNKDKRQFNAALGASKVTLELLKHY